MPLEILHDTPHLIAVRKPAQLAVIPGRAETTSVLERLAAQLNLPCTGTTEPRLRVVHRLDKDTTGVLLFAKDIETQRHLSHQFQNNTIQKEYLALVIGKVASDSGTIDAPIAPHPTVKTRMHVSKHGRPAITNWKIEHRFRDYTLLRCFPKTGKTHQIRLHLAHIGHPLVIDPLYNPTKNESLLLSTFKRNYRATGDGERPLISRLTLHAHKLTFQSPDSSIITIEAALPKDFRSAINMLAKYSRT
jgi:23S rRNA pseudouridine1911/1915/1917 synthase